jgi:hypothetical protein
MKKGSLRIAASALALSGAVVLGTVQGAGAATTTKSHLSLRSFRSAHAAVLEGKLFTGQSLGQQRARIHIIERGQGEIGRTFAGPTGSFSYKLGAPDGGSYVAVFKGLRIIRRSDPEEGGGAIESQIIAPSRSDTVTVR